jgi:hypothetical protein
MYVGVVVCMYVRMCEYLIILKLSKVSLIPVAYPGILFGGGGSKNSVEDRGQREQGSGGSSLLVKGSAQFAND